MSLKPSTDAYSVRPDNHAPTPSLLILLHGELLTPLQTFTTLRIPLHSSPLALLQYVRLHLT